MEWTQVSKDWANVQNKFKTQWSKLSDADIKAIAGKRDELVVRLGQCYSLEKNAAQKDADGFVEKLKA